MTPDLEEGTVAYTSSRSIQREAQRTSEEEEGSQEPSGQGQGQSKFTQMLPIRVKDPQIGAFTMDSVFNMARTLMELTEKEEERMNRTFPRK
ncbi:hypothetical protein O181_061567 [Austropuccinia psidii MF-1]|uniref:Uncharacterized protein n=1 Tax=Austropuccinia psidii MF-1 TaxID=1389203 RepID=A0A9Q3EQN9_9BASI|nr:hypothetical protein [Austropuccinia psidii MF-1]